MPTQLTAEDARQSLNAHAMAKGEEVFATYGPHIGIAQLWSILRNPACVRYPCGIDFDDSALLPGEFAWPEPHGDNPEDGYTLHVHPRYMNRPDLVPFLALYQIVVINYGPFASSDDAETYAAAALGIDRESYYATLCELADELGAGIDPGSGCTM